MNPTPVLNLLLIALVCALLCYLTSIALRLATAVAAAAVRATRDDVAGVLRVVGGAVAVLVGCMRDEEQER